jgi:hypothetical protein
MIPAAILLAIVTQNPVVRAEQGVTRLGGPGYAARERVGTDLIQLGRFALPALRRGQTHRDLEIAERCKRLLPLAEAEAVRQRVAFLLDSPLRPVPADVPKARRFLEVTGDTDEARRRYVEMYVAHAAILEKVERAGADGGEVFWRWLDREFLRGDENLKPWQSPSAPTPRRLPNRADVAVFLLLSADPILRPANSTAVAMSEFPLLTGDAAREAFTGPDASPAMWQLLLTWLVGPRNFKHPGAEATRVQEAFHLAATTGLKAARPVALRIARDRDQWQVARAAALLALARLGEPADVEALVPLMTDRTHLGTSNAGQAELGDVALAVCLQLAGRSPNGFGFGPSAEFTEKPRPDALDFGFPGPAERTAARRKWADLAADRARTTGGMR